MNLGRGIVTMDAAVLGCHVTGYAAWMSHVRHPPNLPSWEAKNRYVEANVEHTKNRCYNGMFYFVKWICPAKNYW
jgi:hypothetical protein